LDEVCKQLIFEIDGSEARITAGELIPPLLIGDMDSMMYELRMNVNAQYNDMEIVGFGKNDEAQKYILFIKI
jgi:thiamine pyrophosphokinase